MAKESTVEQSHTQNYDYNIRWNFQRLWRLVAKLAVAWLSLAAYIYYLYYVPHSYGSKAEMIYAIHFFLVIFFAAYVLSLSFVYGLKVIGMLRTIYNQIRYKNIARKYPFIIHEQVINAYKNVQPFLLNPRKAKWTPRRFRKMFRQYAEFEQFGTDELKQRLEKAGVFDVKAIWYQKGKTIEDALMLAIHSARLEAEEVKIEATEKSLEATEILRQVMPDIHSRKEQELSKEAIEKELSAYVGARAQSEPRELKTLDGQYVIHSINGEKARIVFTLAPGEYIAELYDYREQKRDAESFAVDRDGGAHVLKLNGRGFSEHTEITLIDKGSGAREEIALW